MQLFAAPAFRENVLSCANSANLCGLACPFLANGHDCHCAVWLMARWHARRDAPVPDWERVPLPLPVKVQADAADTLEDPMEIDGLPGQQPAERPTVRLCVIQCAVCVA